MNLKKLEDNLPPYHDLLVGISMRLYTIIRVFPSNTILIDRKFVPSNIHNPTYLALCQ